MNGLLTPVLAGPGTVHSGQFEKAATTFSKFNALYSTDPRISDTTLWIAESVAKFANAEQACTIYENLGQFLDQPPESFCCQTSGIICQCRLQQLKALCYHLDGLRRTGQWLAIGPAFWLRFLL